MVSFFLCKFVLGMHISVFGVSLLLVSAKGYSEPSQDVWHVGDFSENSQGWRPLIIFAKSFILVVWLCSEYTSIVFRLLSVWIIMNLFILLCFFSMYYVNSVKGKQLPQILLKPFEHISRVVLVFLLLTLNM